MAVPRSNGASPAGDISYAYMFEADKSPTMQFDALLRAMARFIVRLSNLARHGQKTTWLMTIDVTTGH
jgi:hypothetical protein